MPSRTSVFGPSSKAPHNPAPARRSLAYLLISYHYGDRYAAAPVPGGEPVFFTMFLAFVSEPIVFTFYLPFVRGGWEG